MKTRNKKARKTEMLRFRCDASMKTEIIKIALLQGLDESDVMRLALLALIQKFNQAMPQQTILPNG